MLKRQAFKISDNNIDDQSPDFFNSIKVSAITGIPVDPRMSLSTNLVVTRKEYLEKFGTFSQASHLFSKLMPDKTFKQYVTESLFYEAMLAAYRSQKFERRIKQKNQVHTGAAIPEAPANIPELDEETPPTPIPNLMLENSPPSSPRSVSAPAPNTASTSKKKVASRSIFTPAPLNTTVSNTVKRLPPQGIPQLSAAEIDKIIKQTDESDNLCSKENTRGSCIIYLDDSLGKHFKGLKPNVKEYLSIDTCKYSKNRDASEAYQLSITNIEFFTASLRKCEKKEKTEQQHLPEGLDLNEVPNIEPPSFPILELDLNEIPNISEDEPSSPRPGR
jgi:hypothetical protein